MAWKCDPTSLLCNIVFQQWPRLQLLGINGFQQWVRTEAQNRPGHEGCLSPRINAWIYNMFAHTSACRIRKRIYIISVRCKRIQRKKTCPTASAYMWTALRSLVYKAKGSDNVTLLVFFNRIPIINIAWNLCTLTLCGPHYWAFIKSGSLRGQQQYLLR